MGNARGVDLNRNFPMRWAPSAPGRTFGGPFPLSEPESRLLLALIDRERPALIVSFHADMRCNNYDGPAAATIAREMARMNGYKLLPDIGYPTPGSLGQQAAYGMGIPIVTLEVGHEAPAPLYAKVRDSLMLGLRGP
jgi:protein MpaA